MIYQRQHQRAEQYNGDNNPFEALSLSLNAPCAFLQDYLGHISTVIRGDWIVEVERDKYMLVKPDAFMRDYWPVVRQVTPT